MVGDWIKWCKGLARKREVMVLASKLKRDRHEIAGRLMVFWEWCDDNLAHCDFDDDGNASLHVGDNPLASIDETVGLPGFAEALASPEVCWLSVRSGGRITFPNLGRHNGSTAKTRAYEWKKKRKQRGGESPKPSPEVSPNNRDKTGTRARAIERERESETSSTSRLSTDGGSPLPISPGDVSGRRKARIRFDSSLVDWDRVVVDVDRIQRLVPAVTHTDAVHWCQVAALTQPCGVLSEGFLPEVLDRVKTGTPQETVQKHFMGLVKTRASSEEHVPDILTYMKAVNIPDNVVEEVGYRNQEQGATRG